MPIEESDRKIFSLLEVTRSIQKTLSDRYSTTFWVKAEMNKLNLHNQSGHCYPELVEKNEGKVIAQLKSILWNDAYRKCNRKFQRVLNEPLHDGIKILFLAKINFDSVFGLSLVILDIDPSYTVGDLEREKQETIQRLITEGIINQNRSLPFPLLPQRIAIISVETSKGYADFEKVISTNNFGYAFFTMLFPALLQGDKSIDSILYQLSRVKKVTQHFDVVAIIRGGGGDVGLSSYNDYRLAREIALFPIPVLTGIGHATNETVSEMVANFNAITPTKLAEHIIQHFHNFAVPVRDAERKIHDKGLNMLEHEKERFNSAVKLFRSVADNLLLTRKHGLREVTSLLYQQSRSIFKSSDQHLTYLKQTFGKGSREMLKRFRNTLRETTSTINSSVQSKLKSHALEVGKIELELAVHSRRTIKTETVGLTYLEKNLDNLNPKNVLKRGYSITLHNGRAVKNANDLNAGDKISTEVFEGKIESTVTTLDNTTNG